MANQQQWQEFMGPNVTPLNDFKNFTDYEKLMYIEFLLRYGDSVEREAVWDIVIDGFIPISDIDGD